MQPPSHFPGDELDRRIVAHLLDHSRATFSDIGADVGLSASAVKRRVDRLRDRGVIRGFTAMVDRGHGSPRTEAYVELYCAERTSRADIRCAMERHPEVAEICVVAGAPSAVVRLCADDLEHLERTLERIRLEPDVLRTRSVIVLSRLIERHTRRDRTRADAPQAGAKR
ncbi:Lrp/AsnC family transcriptional regulator [Actinomadura decatromicini]|uniref:Lrp/AsnC family transcriptional regulator n=1 Tax=Actinomadura decatromicini TaxID=2604572 RepID=A0A5D3F4R9_9ACTN|nr:Lrp/AsnC family transcriptional regulator [Actinomadura decatromicini]TYK43059.1 Lrp/AsnC family transcriptional regulator [Actinomadura decatromicini]